MAHVGCAGFPVPASRYLRELAFVEVAETALSAPGPALVRRWRREAPPDFTFTVLAPKALCGAGFAENPEGDAAWAEFVPVARELGARAIVLLSPPETTSSKPHRAAARSLFERVLAKAPPAPLVWEPPALWDLRDAESVVKGLEVTVARDPTKHAPYPAKGTPLAYFRLAGPAGHRSRYEDVALEAIAASVKNTRADETFVVLSNADMHSDATRLARIVAG